MSTVRALVLSLPTYVADTIVEGRMEMWLILESCTNACVCDVDTYIDFKHIQRQSRHYMYAYMCMYM
jgi:hypothetical protein